MKDYITYLKFDDLNLESLINHYNDDIRNNRQVITITPNLDILRISYRDSYIRYNINNSDYVTIDGKPILWLAKICHKRKFKYKISGSDLSIRLLEEANKFGYSITIFGGKEGVAEKAKYNIQKKYLNIKNISAICPDFGFEKDEEKSFKYIEMINKNRSNIILLCTGFPKTEYFFFKNRKLFNNGLYFCVGASVDFLAGNIKRSPKWMSSIGLEWLYRLSKDFKRLFKRYWFDFWFLIKIIHISIFNKKKFEKMI